MEEQDDNQKAFPDSSYTVERGVPNRNGLTKREYYAAKALQGLMVQSIPGNHNCDSDNWNKGRAVFAVNMADALIEVLESDINKIDK